jgi:hypothetical protein
LDIQGLRLRSAAFLIAVVVSIARAAYLEISGWRNVVVAVRDLPRYHQISRGDVKVERRRGVGEDLDRVDHAEGRYTLVYITAASSLTSEMLGPKLATGALKHMALIELPSRGSHHVKGQAAELVSRESNGPPSVWAIVIDFTENTTLIAIPSQRRSDAAAMLKTGYLLVSYSESKGR